MLLPSCIPSSSAVSPSPLTPDQLCALTEGLAACDLRQDAALALLEAAPATEADARLVSSGFATGTAGITARIAPDLPRQSLSVEAGVLS